MEIPPRRVWLWVWGVIPAPARLCEGRLGADTEPGRASPQPAHSQAGTRPRTWLWKNRNAFVVVEESPERSGKDTTSS